jgi:hypothetical protein
MGFLVGCLNILSLIVTTLSKSEKSKRVFIAEFSLKEGIFSLKNMAISRRTGFFLNESLT